MKAFTRAVRIALVLTLAIGPSQLAPTALAQDGPREKLDYAMIAKIREEGLNRSQVMDHISLRLQRGDA